jgi:hypothetical protein
LTTSSPTFDPTSLDPFYLIVTAHILATPRPESSVVLTTHLNPFDKLSNRSFNNITCVSPEASASKKIEIYPTNWPHYIWDAHDLRKSWDFVTVPVDGKLVVKHELNREEVSKAGVEKGERYRASFTDKCLGTRWWTFGSVEGLEGVKLGQWSEDGRGESENGNIDRGEKPDGLALVIENGEAEFEIV